MEQGPLISSGSVTPLLTQLQVMLLPSIGVGTSFVNFVPGLGIVVPGEGRSLTDLCCHVVRSLAGVVWLAPGERKEQRLRRGEKNVTRSTHEESAARNLGAEAADGFRSK